MRSNILVGVVLISAVLFAGCTQHTPESPSAAVDHVNAADAAAQAPVILYNAYTSKTVDASGVASAPVASFSTEDKVYVGVVIHGAASAADVKVEWSLVGGPVLGSEETKLPIATAAVATLELTKSGPLSVGDYKAIVLLNGKAGWELKFNVSK